MPKMPNSRAEADKTHYSPWNGRPSSAIQDFFDDDKMHTSEVESAYAAHETELVIRERDTLKIQLAEANKARTQQAETIIGLEIDAMISEQKHNEMQAQIVLSQQKHNEERNEWEVKHRLLEQENQQLKERLQNAKPHQAEDTNEYVLMPEERITPDRDDLNVPVETSTQEHAPSSQQLVLPRKPVTLGSGERDLLHMLWLPKRESFRNIAGTESSVFAEYFARSLLDTSSKRAKWGQLSRNLPTHVFAEKNQCVFLDLANSKKHCEWTRGQSKERACDTCIDCERICARVVKDGEQLVVVWYPLPQNLRRNIKLGELRFWTKA